MGLPESLLYGAIGHATSSWIEENRESDGAELTEGFSGRRGCWSVAGDEGVKVVAISFQ
jgi:hypothetical protein